MVVRCFAYSHTNRNFGVDCMDVAVTQTQKGVLNEAAGNTRAEVLNYRKARS